MLPGIRRPCLIASAASALLITGAAPSLGQLSFEAGPEAPNGRSYPLVPNTPLGLAQQLAQVEAALGANNPEQLGTLAHRQQVLFRHWARHLDWDRTVLGLLPEGLRPRAQLQLQARREFLAMHRGAAPPTQLPAWRIGAPAPATAAGDAGVSRRSITPIRGPRPLEIGLTCRWASSERGGKVETRSA
jgi:hypothetical protein